MRKNLFGNRKDNYFFKVGAAQIAILSMLSVFVLVSAGCSDEPARGSGPLIVFDEKAFATEIAEAGSLIDLARIKKDFETTGEYSPPIKQALEDRWSALLAETEPIGPICEEADLIEVEYIATGLGSWRLDYLFKVNKPFEDDYSILLRAYVDSLDREWLTADASQEGGYELWGFTPTPPTSEWPEGEYVLIHRPLPMAQPVPYRFVTGFYKPGVLRYGAEVDLGWWAPGPVSEDELIKAVQAAADVFELARLRRLQGDRRGWTSAVDSGFREAWAGLANQAKPNKAFSDQVDLVAFDYKLVGKDRYLLSYLFDVKEKIDADPRISIHGYVDDDHLHYLPEERRQYKFSTWSFAPDPPVSTWRAGEKVLVTTEITARPIPYNIVTGFSPIGGGDHKSRCEVGWQADPGR
jgi:hypothetical protein